MNLMTFKDQSEVQPRTLVQAGGWLCSK